MNTLTELSSEYDQIEIEIGSLQERRANLVEAIRRTLNNGKLDVTKAKSVEVAKVTITPKATSRTSDEEKAWVAKNPFRIWRAEKSKSVAAVIGDREDLSPATISSFERGKTEARDATLKTLAKVARIGFEEFATSYRKWYAEKPK